MVGQVDATIAAALLFALASLARHRLSPTLRSAILLIALVRIVLPAFIQSPWSEAAVDLPTVDDTRLFVSGILQDDRAKYVFGIAASVSLFLLARLARQMRNSRSQLMATSSPAPAWLEHRARDLAGDSTLASTIEVRIAAGEVGPLAAGLRRPLIILPAAAIGNLDPVALDAALAHEIAHHANRDLIWIATARALAAIAWFNPLAHVITRAITASREDGSDDWALARTSNDAFAYAQALLKSARVAAEGGAAFAAGAHPMGGRLRRLLDQHTARDRRLGPLSVAAILIVITLAIPGAHMPESSSARDSERIVIVIRK